MMHKAVHFAVTVKTRSNTSSLVGAAAYRAGASLFDEQIGLRKSYLSRRDVVSVEMIRAAPDIEAFWNSAQKAETRINSRLAREIKIALPHELPLETQRRLVRGYCLWLHDAFGMSSMAAIHHPFVDGVDREILSDLVPYTEGHSTSKPSRNDDRGNPLNTHVHILCPTRKWLPDEGRFGAKLRELDDLKTGPEAVQRMRSEWEKRVNAELEKVGVEERVDLRSYKAMAADGDAPEGLVAQPKLGPRNTARSRRRKRETGTDDTFVGAERASVRDRNDELWATWLELRALKREKAREMESASIAARQEVERAEAARRAEHEIKVAPDLKSRHDAIEKAPHIDALNPWAQAIAWAEHMTGTDENPPGSDEDPAGTDDDPTETGEGDEFERVFDPETDSAVSDTEHIEIPWRSIRRAPRVRERKRGD